MEAKKMENLTEAADIFQLVYYPIHAYLSIVISSIGIIANAIGIVVLTRANMRSTVNFLLSAIAVADSILMIIYVHYIVAWRLVEQPCATRPITYGWAIFELVFADAGATLRGFSLWLAVFIAAMRLRIMRSHQLHKAQTTDGREVALIIAACALLVITLSVPVYLSNTILIEKADLYSDRLRLGPPLPKCENETYYTVQLSNLSVQNDHLIGKLAFWSNGVFLRLLPCGLLTVLICFLLPFVRRRFRPSDAEMNGIGGEHRRTSGTHASCVAHGLPTTFLLLIILIVTWLMETPHSVLCIAAGLFPSQYPVYQNLGDVFDLLSLLNCTSTFILYCIMSSTFRQRLIEICTVESVQTRLAIFSTVYYQLVATRERATQQQSTTTESRDSNL